MKVLHITNAYPYRDYESFGIFIKEQIESLNNQNITTKTIFINANKFGNKEYFKNISKIKKEIKEFMPDLIHCHHEFSVIPLLFIRFKKPVILSLLGDLGKRKIINKLIFYILVKHRVKKIILKNKIIKKNKFTYLPNGVDLEKFQDLSTISSKNTLCLDQNKDYALFVTASLNNPIKRYDKFLSVIEKLKLDHNIELQPLILSGVKRELVPHYYNSSKLLILTSDHEGSPNAIKEAMASNLLIVSTDVGDVGVMFGSTNGLLLSKSGSIADLTVKCTAVLKYEYSDGRQRLINLKIDMTSIAYDLKQIYLNSMS
jgi:glycosyltransferase involved in cell wall biosynthesis